jgi:hypothetical protein
MYINIIGLLTWEIYLTVLYTWGYAMTQFVEALRYKPESRGFDS